MMAECWSCPRIFSGKGSGCPDHQADRAEYFGNIEERVPFTSPGR